MTTANEPVNLDQLIIIAADSINTLRKQDVYRVLDSNPEHMKALANYISQHRPDLADEARDVLSELCSDDERFKP